MRFHWLAAAAVLAIAGASYAQTAVVPMRGGLYVGPTGGSIRVSSTDTGPFAFLGDNNSSQAFKGVTLGGYLDFAHTGALALGVDMRDRILGASNEAKVNSFLVGLRAVRDVRGSRFAPYGEVLVGVAASRAALNPLYLKRAEYGGVVGLDYHLGKHVDFRALEVGYTIFQPVSPSAFGAATAAPTASAITADIGIVLRIP